MKKPTLVHCEKGEYKGNDMAVFDPENRYKFQFGGTKASQLLTACALSGVAVVMRLLLEVAGEKLKPEHVEAITADLLKIEAKPTKVGPTASPRASSKTPAAGSTKSKQSPATEKGSGKGSDKGKRDAA